MFKFKTSNLTDGTRHAGVGPRLRWISKVVGVGLIAAGLTLVASTLSSALRVDDVNRTPPLIPLVNPAEIAQQAQALAGTFTTGDDEGDRAIVIDVGGKIRLQELGPHGTVQIDTADTYRAGRRDGKLYLAVARGGQVEVANRDLLVYYRDTYRRVR